MHMVTPIKWKTLKIPFCFDTDTHTADACSRVVFEMSTHGFVETDGSVPVISGFCVTPSTNS